MSHQRVEAGAAGGWYARGWQLFTKNPGMWIVLALLFGIVYFGLSLVPLVGGFAAALLSPALLGGLVHGAGELDHGRPLEVAHLFQAFREPGRASPMLMLGLVPLGAAILSGIVGAIALAGTAGAGMADGGHGPGMGMMAGGATVVLLVAIVIGLVAGALLLFAVPRVMLGLAGPLDAVQESLRAVLDNLGAYIGFAVIYIALAIVAAIPLALGFLVLIPVMAGAVHAAHAQVFGAAPAADTPGGDEDDATVS